MKVYGKKKETSATAKVKLAAKYSNKIWIGKCLFAIFSHDIRI